MSFKQYFKSVNAKSQIKKLAKKYKNKKIVLYGAGKYFLCLQENYDLSCLNIVGIVDKKFETTKDENPTKWQALTPNELKTFDFDVILIALYDDSSLCNYLETDLLINTKNENVEIHSIIEPTLFYIFLYILKNGLKKDFIVFRKYLKRKYFTNKTLIYKELFKNHFRVYNFLKDIANPKQSEQIKNCTIEEKTKLNKARTYKEKYKSAKILSETMLNIVDIKTVGSTKEPILRKEQLRCVDFAKEMTDIFDAQGFEYFITSGTLIGAVRHKAFVPWDDDFDVGMVRKDYERLKTFLKENYKEIPATKMSLKKTRKLEIFDSYLKKNKGELLFFIGPKYIQMCRGNSIGDCTILDIFFHEYYKNGYTYSTHKEHMDIINKKILELNNFEKIKKFLNEDIQNNQNIVEFSDIIYYGVDSLGSYIVNPTALMSQNMIFPRKKMEFEGYEFYAPNNPDGYIKVQYPNYWAFPKNLTISPDLDERLEY